MRIKNEEHLYLSDLGLVSALSLSFPYEIAKKDGRKKLLFVFENSSALQEVINNYWNSNLPVDARRYSEQVKSIKSRIYQAL